MMGMIFDVQEMTIHDGPGCRVTFFLKGCPLKCKWCHNPEGQSSKREVLFVKNKCQHCGVCMTEGERNPDYCIHGALKGCGRQWSVQEVVKRVLSLKSTLQMMEGGVTFSGGEPCAQPEFLLECLTLLKKEGIHTAVETSGYCSEEWFQKIVDQCDYLMMDLKIMDDQLHRQMTGVSNQLILQNAQYLKSLNKPICFRTPLIPGITDTTENLSAIEMFVEDRKWEKLPYNELASVKYEQLNRIYEL